MSSVLNNTAPPPKKAKCVDDQPLPKENTKEAVGTNPVFPIQDTPISAVPDAVRGEPSLTGSLAYLTEIVYGFKTVGPCAYMCNIDCKNNHSNMAWL